MRNQLAAVWTASDRWHILLFPNLLLFRHRQDIAQILLERGVADMALLPVHPASPAKCLLHRGHRIISKHGLLFLLRIGKAIIIKHGIDESRETLLLFIVAVLVIHEPLI